MRIRNVVTVGMTVIAVAMGADLAAQSSTPTASASVKQPAPSRATGDQRRHYVFSPTGQQLPYRLFVPPSWDGKRRCR